MTREPDIERVLDQWFAEGPMQMPSRFLEDTLDRLDRAPQRRLAGLRPRLPAFGLNLRLAAAAAIIVVVAAVGSAIIGRVSGVGIAPSATPSATPARSTPPTLVPTALRFAWRSIGTRVVAGEVLPQSQDLIVGEASIRLPEFKSILLNTTSGAGFGRLSVHVDADWADCPAGAAGTYAFSLSADGTTLTLMTVNDECSARSAIFAGDWVRSACPYPEGFCLGDLGSGQHVSANFQPRYALGKPGNNEIYGKLSYSVPAGWANLVDETISYSLTRQGATALTSDITSIQLFSDVAPHSQGPGCATGVAPGVGSTASAIAAWLPTVPGLLVTEPTPVSVGGLQGVMLDLSVVPGWIGCSTKLHFVSTLSSSQPENAPLGEVDLFVGTRARYILLDLGPYPVNTTRTDPALLIEITAPDTADWNAVLADTMPIVTTFQFNH